MNQSFNKGNSESPSNQTKSHHNNIDSFDYSLFEPNSNKPLRKRLRSFTASTSTGTTCSSNNEPQQQKVCLTFFKVSNSSDCYVVKSSSHSKPSLDSRENSNASHHKKTSSTSVIQYPETKAGEEKNLTERTKLRDTTTTTHIQETVKSASDTGQAAEEIILKEKPATSTKTKRKVQDKASFVNNLGLRASVDKDGVDEKSDGLVDKVGSSGTSHKFSRNIQYYGTGKLPCPELGEGWMFEQIVRQQGKSAGQFDVYYYSPSNVRLRSKLKLVNFIGDKMDMKMFDYNAGRFRRNLEIINKKDALLVDKLKWYHEGKPESATVYQTESSEAPVGEEDASQDLSSEPTPPAKHHKQSRKAPVRIKFKRRRKMTSVKNSISPTNSALPDEQDRSSESEGCCYDSDMSRPDDGGSPSDTSNGLLAFRNDVIQKCGDILEFCKNAEELSQEAWNHLKTEKRAWYSRQKVVPRDRIPYQNPEVTESLCMDIQEKIDDTKYKWFNYKPSKRSTRCKVCSACLAPNCGMCASCRDMPQFGGTGKKKQSCVRRRCMYKSPSNIEPTMHTELPTMVPHNMTAPVLSNLTSSVPPTNAPVLTSEDFRTPNQNTGYDNPFLNQQVYTVQNNFYKPPNPEVQTNGRSLEKTYPSYLVGPNCRPRWSLPLHTNAPNQNYVISQFGVPSKPFVDATFSSYTNFPIVTARVDAQPFVHSMPAANQSTQLADLESDTGQSLPTTGTTSTPPTVDTPPPNSPPACIRRRRKSSKPEHYFTEVPGGDNVLSEKLEISDKHPFPVK